MKTIDARGLSCPQPVILTKKALDAGEGELEVLVDNNTAKENITRFCTSLGCKISVKPSEDEFILKVKR